MGNFVSGVPVLSNIIDLFPSMVSLYVCVVLAYKLLYLQDYEGQRLAEKCYQCVIVLFGVNSCMQ